MAQRNPRENAVVGHEWDGNEMLALIARLRDCDWMLDRQGYEKKASPDS